MPQNHSLVLFDMGCCHSNSSPSSLERGNDEEKSDTSIKTYNPAQLEDIIDDHQEILSWIEINGHTLLSVDKVRKGKTLIRKILEEAGDGHLVVSKVLDSYVSAPKDVKPQSNKYGVTVDFSGLIREDKDTGIQKSVLRDILDLKMKYQDTVLDLGGFGFTWFHRMFCNDDRMGNQEDFADTFRGILNKLFLETCNK